MLSIKAHLVFLMAVITVQAGRGPVVRPSDTPPQTCSYTFLVPRTSAEEGCPGQCCDNNYREEIDLLKSIIQTQQEVLTLLLRERDDRENETTPAPPVGNASVNYIRYGHKQCSNTSHIIYEGEFE